MSFSLRIKENFLNRAELALFQPDKLLKHCNLPYISYIRYAGHNVPDKSCVADTAMHIELAKHLSKIVLQLKSQYDLNVAL